MQRALLILTFLSLSCATQNASDYSADFMEHMEQSGIVLSADSLLFPVSAGIEYILIPGEIQIGKEALLRSESSETLLLKRLNYTDYYFEYDSPQFAEQGHVSLFPNFYMGAEFRGQESCACSVYYQKSSAENSKISSIDIGRNMEMNGSICVWVSFKEKMTGQAGVLFL